MTSDRIAIVLIADQAYTEQLTVTMKSIMYHNKSVDFYIINQGIMTDWFRKVRRVAKILGGAVYSIPFDTDLINPLVYIIRDKPLIFEDSCTVKMIVFFYIYWLRDMFDTHHFANHQFYK